MCLPNNDQDGRASWVFVLDRGLVLNYGTYVFSKECLFLYVLTPLYGAQVLNELSIVGTCIIKLRRGMLTFTCLSASRM